MQISPLQVRYLQKTKQTHKTNAYIQTSSGIRSHDPSGQEACFSVREYFSCIRPLGQCDRHLQILKWLKWVAHITRTQGRVQTVSVVNLYETKQTFRPEYTEYS
jgi:hypothetical protein